jgi:voltage-gated potassium channel
MPIFHVVAKLLNRVPHQRIALLIAVALTIIVTGAGLFSITQHDSYWLSLYWAITTATTVGYGDVTPTNTIGRVIASAVMLTTIPIVGAVFGLLAGASAVSHIRRIFGMDTRLPSEPYTVIYGMHPVVTHVLQELCDREDPVVLVAPERPPQIPAEVVFVAGDMTDDAVISRSRPENADRALIACDDEADTMVVAVTLHGIAPRLKTYALTASPRVARALSELGVDHTLAAEQLVGHTVAKSLETPEAGDLLLQLVEAGGLRLEELIVDAALDRKTLSSARSAAGTLVLGIARDGKVDLGVGDDPILAVGDRLIVLRDRGRVAAAGV